MIRRWLRWQATVERRFIAHLRAEVLYWRQQYERERQRAEVAIDVCRMQHQATAAVSLPKRVEAPETAMRSAVEELLKQPEFGAIGQEVR